MQILGLLQENKESDNAIAKLEQFVSLLARLVREMLGSCLAAHKGWLKGREAGEKAKQKMPIYFHLSGSKMPPTYIFRTEDQ